MPKSRKKNPPKRVVALPDLEQAKTAVLNEFVGWYCSEPCLAFNRTVVLRYRIRLEQRGYAPV